MMPAVMLSHPNPDPDQFQPWGGPMCPAAYASRAHDSMMRICRIGVRYPPAKTLVDSGLVCLYAPVNLNRAEIATSITMHVTILNHDHT